ncbi:PD40 domain-containing protein [Candidatus Bathyarchaeota archaeon]|nr:PD40 domain-containing protein [Candidatus Bathyarchaeota archaeon]
MSRIKTVVIVAVLLVVVVSAIGILSSKPGEQPEETPEQVPETGEETEEPGEEPELEPAVTRESKIPGDVVKQTPEMDLHPPVLHSFLWEDPIPLPGDINTAGGEDSPFISPDGERFYFFFTPDVRVPAELQLVDGVTGIWYSEKVDDQWAGAERLWLPEGGLSLDGCTYVSDEEVWFCSVRLGNYKEIDFWVATLEDGRATNIRNAGEELNVEIGIGEMHISPDGDQIYFHGDREGGMGSSDVWVIEWTGDGWSEPVNVEAVNSPGSEGYPYLSPDMTELWINKWYMGSPGTFRSKWVDGGWTAPQLIVSTFAGEPNLDADGNIYFTHHYYRDAVMLEADIYVAYRKPTVEPADPETSPARGYLMGYLPAPGEGQSFDEVYAWASDSCDVVPVWGRPSPFWEKAGDLGGSWGDIFVEDYTRGNGMAPLVHFSFIGEGVTVSSPPDTSYTLSDEEWRLMYKRAVVETVEAAKPRYLSVGNEVNRWYEKYGLEGANGFTEWVSLYEEIYDEVKELSPETEVFCTFSREIVSEYREADMTVIDLFDPEKLDMLVITSYPYSLSTVNRPDDLPDDYYSSVADMMPGKPFGFSEIAWSSMSAFGGEAAQAEFISMIPEMTVDRGVDLELLMWPWLHDLSEQDDAGLIEQSGAEKQGYEAWLSLYGLAQ